MTTDDTRQPVVADHHGPLATPADVAAYLHTSMDGLAQMRYRRDGPPYIKIGRKVLYDWADVIAWKDTRRVHAAR